MRAEGSRLSVACQLTYAHDDLSGGASCGNGVVSSACLYQPERPGVEPRGELAGLDQIRRPFQDFAVVRATFAGQQRQQREHA